MIDRQAFFDYAREHLFGGTMSQSQVDGITGILDAWENDWDESDDRHLAYMLATAHHETDRTMQPIAEYGKGKNKMYGQRLKQNGSPYMDTPALFYGRGFVQLTWYENYYRAGKLLGIDLIHYPELAMMPEHATKIMFYGMRDGWFTGVALKHYFNASRGEWVQARRIINGLDRAELVAGYGRLYHAALQAGFSDVVSGVVQ